MAKFNTTYGFDQAFIQAVQAYVEHFRSQCQITFLPSDQTIRASWGKMLERLSAAAASEPMV